VNPILAAQLGFEVPQGAAWLTLLAAALLAFEYVWMLAGIWRESSATRAVLRTLGALAGPISAAGSIAYAVMTAVGGQRLRGLEMFRLGVHASFLHGLALLLWFGLGPGWPHASLIVLTCEAALWAYRSYRRTTSPLGRFWKQALLVFRVLVILLLGAYVARPSLAYERTRLRRRAILVGVDTSASMQRRDMPAAYDQEEITARTQLVPRIEAVRSALAGKWPLLEKLAQTSEVRVFLFSSTASPAMPLDDPQLKTRLFSAPADGQSTALGDATLQAIRQMDRARREVAAVVLISDGNQNARKRYSPQRLMEDLSLRGIPLSTVGAGWETVTASTRSLQAVGITSPDEINAFNRMRVEGDVRAIGLAGRQVEVTCRFGQEEVGKVILDIPGRDEVLKPEFVHVPLRTGYHRLKVETKLIGEIPQNLEQTPAVSKLVHVVDRGLRILYVDGKVRYEVKFIKQALASSDRIELRPILLQSGRAQDNGLGQDIEDWLVYHAVLLGSVGPENFTQAQLEILKKLVDEKGKGLGMLGGPNAFGAGGWDATVLADVLPVDFARSRGQIDQPVEVRPTRAGRVSDMMAIGPTGQDTSESWAELDPLPGANRLEVKQGALVLAESQRGEPMVVQGRYGAGRTLAVAFDTTHQWVLTPKDTAAMQKRFWRQVALFLADPKGNIWITTDKASYDREKLSTGEEVVEIRAGVEDSAGRPLFDVPQERATLTDPQGRTTQINLLPQQRMRMAKLVRPPAQTGTYILRLEGRVAGEMLQAEHQFEVIERDLEGRDVLANHDLLRQLAKKTDAQFARLANLGPLLSGLEDRAKPRLETISDPRPLWKEWAWWLAGLLVGLLCLEWALRKRKGLV
jgi:hypothetical protein